MHTKNMQVLSGLRERYYFSVLEDIFNWYCQQYGVAAVGNYLTEIMQKAEPAINDLIEERKKNGIICSTDQARKSIAGNGFQSLVFLTLVTMQSKQLISARIIFSLKPKSHPIINQFAVIKVSDEVLKPDMDLMAYTEECQRVAIYSLKTSMRERAGQTHRWKLLMDIATAQDAESIRRKYKISYTGGRQFSMNFITTNFYDEITSPQQRGMLGFFDRVYLTKPGEFEAPVLNFSHIAQDLSAVYGV